MWPLKWNLSSHFGLLRGSFWPFSDSKIKLPGFLKVVLGVFEKLFRNYFYLNNALLWGYFQLKRLIFVLKKKICQIGQFDHFRAQKSCTFDFLKNVWVVFWSYLSITFGFKRPIFKCNTVISATGVEKWTQNQKCWSNFGRLRRSLWSFSVFMVKKAVFWTFSKSLLNWLEFEYGWFYPPKGDT